MLKLYGRSTTVTKKLTLEEYLAYDDGTDNRYELVDGELMEIPPETKRNNLIAIYLLSTRCLQSDGDSDPNRLSLLPSASSIAAFFNW
jgi:Uma2 family endonuclease